MIACSVLEFRPDFGNLETFSLAIKVRLCAENFSCTTALTQFSKYDVANFGIYTAETVALKISLAIFFLRIVTVTTYRYVIYTACLTYTIYGVFYFFIAIFQCGDPTSYLLHEIEGTCISWKVLGPLAYLQASLNAVTDWVYAIMPIFLIWDLQMARSTKWSVCACLMLATLGSVASVVRIGYLSGLADKNNYFAATTPLAIWSIVESGLGIIAGSLATLKPLFQRMGMGTQKSQRSKPGNSHRLSYLKLDRSAENAPSRPGRHDVEELSEQDNMTSWKSGLSFITEAELPPMEVDGIRKTSEYQAISRPMPTRVRSDQSKY